MNDPGMEQSRQEAPEQDEYVEEIDVHEAGVSGGRATQPLPAAAVLTAAHQPADAALLTAASALLLRSNLPAGKDCA